MQRLLALVTLCLLTAASRGEIAPVSLVSFSVQIQPATVRNVGLVTTLSVSSTGQPNNPNAELELADETIPFTHDSFFILDSVTFPEPVPFLFGLDVPNQGDSNTNGLADFFDLGMETPGLKTDGTYKSPLGGTEDFTATWTRAAGSSAGKVVISLPDFGTFTHDYAILQYDGTLTYSLTNKSITGAIVLTNIVAADDTISGPLSVTITNNTKLGYDSGTWAGSTGGTYTFHSIDSLDRVGTDYIALTAFDDGYSATSDEDYHYWFLLIHSADANNNDVLDLIETVAPWEPDAPRLEIRKVEAGLEISVFGAAGSPYSLESADSLANPTWSTLQTITLKSSPQTVQVDSSGAMRFFRLRHQ
jgi:hypothetical protein